MNESTKSKSRREAEGFYTRYLTGSVIDIGCGTDPIVPHARSYDVADGDAQKLMGIEDASFDTVYSSHLIEHLRDPHEGLFNMWRILKPGGYLIFAVPSEDHYEQGIVPSPWNPDHRITLTISKDKSWSPRSINVFDLLVRLPDRNVIYVRTIDTNYDYSKLGVDPMVDQTKGDAEAAIEVVVQKMDKQVLLRTALQQLIVCPTCKRTDLAINGKTHEGKIDLRCTGCGFMGSM